jgi:hypothetical protein
LADTFYGLGSMDKAGTGLADVEDLMREHGGSTRFTAESTNSALRASLFQPRQKTPGQAVATPVIKTEVYLTNLLPFAVMPPAVSMLPLTHWNSRKQPYLFDDERSSDLPIFIEHDRHIVTFADLTDFRTFAERRGDYHHVVRIERDAFAAQPERRKVLVWLLGKHWERFLYRLSPQGLFVDRERRRAYFRLTDGKKTNTITYNSAKRRGVSREVVKRRTYRTWVEHENEGIAYWIAQYGDTWTVAIKPLYVFTQHDGRTPLSSNTQTRRSTQRMKFDRNPSVESDLVFWARILSDGQPVVNLGGPGATNLLLDSAFCSAEVPEGIQETP